MAYVCSAPKCPVLLDSAGKCIAHRRQAEQARGTTTERGYGAAHQALRAQWKRNVDTGNVLCARCGEPIRPDQTWDLGHNDSDRSKYAGPEHANQCNRAAGGRMAQHGPLPF
jgi:hypothetical protein